MSRLFRRYLPALLLAAAFMASCGPAATEEPTVTDDLERQVSFSPPATRIFPLAPNVTEQIVAAGGADQLVAVSTADTYPPWVDELPRIGTLPLDFEALVAEEPDLVVANAEINPERDAETLDALGIPTLFLTYTTVADVPRTIRLLGTWLGTEAEADATADTLTAQFDAFRAAADTVKHRPRVLFLIGDETLYAYGAGSYVHELIAMAGGESITATLPAAAPVLSEEFVLTQRPDVIVGSFGEGYTTADLLAKHPTWDIVPAVRDGRVYSIDGALISRPGPRLLRGVQALRAAIHGDTLDVPLYLPHLP